MKKALMVLATDRRQYRKHTCYFNVVSYSFDECLSWTEHFGTEDHN